MVSSAYGQSSLPACQGSDVSRWTNCFGSTTYTNGKFNGKFVGEWKDGKYHGQGTYTSTSGFKYVGEFKDERFNGKGTYTFTNGNEYVGEYKDNNFNGQGTFTFANGDKYVGEYKDDMQNGQGTFTFANGEKHVGEFKDDKRNGLGIEYRADGIISRSGRWVYDKLAQSFALDKNRFPFNAPIQTASAPQALVLDPLEAERDRLTAEVEAERKKRQELEQQLASSKERERITAELDTERRKRQELQAELDRAKELAESRLADQQRPQAVQRTERRVALVIGNGQYKSSPLENSVNDATDIDQALKRFGFQTTFLRNASLSQMRESTRRFADQLTTADVALIYFAGHGIESKNKNYMIPVNSDIKFEYELADQAYDAGAWLEMLEMIKSNNAERVNIVILDACRNNNLIGSRSLNRGLGRMDAPAGTFLSYSTAPGKVAADGGKGERNSPFTRNLLKAIQQPGQPIEEVFKEVRRNVTRETNGAQVPWESTSLTGFFSFRQTR